MSTGTSIRCKGSQNKWLCFAETLSGALKLCQSKFRKINCVHCFKLFNNKDLVVSMLKDYPEVSLSLCPSAVLNIIFRPYCYADFFFFFLTLLQKGSNPRPEYLSLVAPGNKIPSGSAIRMTVLGQQQKGLQICMRRTRWWNMLFVKFTNCRTPAFITLQLNCYLRSDGIMGASPFLFMP